MVYNLTFSSKMTGCVIILIVGSKENILLSGANHASHHCYAMSTLYPKTDGTK